VYLLWQVRTVPISKIKLQLGLIFGIRIRIEFYVFKNWTQNEVLGFIYIMQLELELEPELKYMSLREKLD
jgi:hypothetical protein